jgi:hypothetical protein
MMMNVFVSFVKIDFLLTLSSQRCLRVSTEDALASILFFILDSSKSGIIQKKYTPKEGRGQCNV